MEDLLRIPHPYATPPPQRCLLVGTMRIEDYWGGFGAAPIDWGGFGAAPRLLPWQAQAQGGRRGASKRASTGTGLIQWKENNPLEGQNVCDRSLLMRISMSC